MEEAALHEVKLAEQPVRQTPLFPQPGTELHPLVWLTQTQTAPVHVYVVVSYLVSLPSQL